MGNQVSLNYIYPVEYYLEDYANELTFDANLGSTRFMKVAKIKHKQAGYCVAKIYAINDPNLPIKDYIRKYQQIRENINNLNSLPFEEYFINEKCVIIIRQYIKYNLYDRLSTRPFLTTIEKSWIAYQLLRCIESLHQVSVYHGDIKSENVLVTSFLWVMLADFASFKPVILPENNPSDFLYFFDTSRRHCCNMAPERFICPTTEATSENRLTSNESEPKLTAQMDLFSLGCVLAELFSDDTPNSSIFDLGQILMFKKGQYDPSKLIEESINDPKVRRLILNMTELDPNNRNSASYHLDKLVPSFFPGYFVKLYDYIVKLMPLEPDAKIFLLNKDLDKLIVDIVTEHDRGLLLPLILITSTIRSLESTDSKLLALKLCLQLIDAAPVVMSDYIIDRLLPYVINMLDGSESLVKASAISAVTTILSHIRILQPTDSNVFIDYILPNIAPLATDESNLVRIALATDISNLAEISRSLMESQDDAAKLASLQDSFGVIVGRLLGDPNHDVRRAVLDKNVSRLCKFFGPDKTDEVILSHMITFLNFTNDFRLRAAFYDNIGLVCASLNPHYAQVVKPFLQKGLADSEEGVIEKALRAISSMTSSNLLLKEVVYELFQEAVPLMSFPNKWIRNAMIEFILVLSKTENPDDFNQRILPTIKLHLSRDITTLHDEIVLLDSLPKPLPRNVIDCILNGDDDEIFHSITKRKVNRDSKRYRNKSANPNLSSNDSKEDDAMSVDATQQNGGGILATIDVQNEDKLIDSELILRQILKNKRNSSTRRIQPSISIKRLDGDLQSIGGLASSHAGGQYASEVGRKPIKMVKPRGLLLATLQEHKNSVNKILVLQNQTQKFVTCSSDATIKIWDSTNLTTRPQVLFRSKQTIVMPDAGPVTTIAQCLGSNNLMALTENNKLHFIDLVSSSGGSQPMLNDTGIKTVNYDDQARNLNDRVTQLVALSPFMYATSSTSSQIRGYDTRLPAHANVWSMSMGTEEGLISCMDGTEFCVACGTSSSIIGLFDLRFYVRSTSIHCPLHQNRVKRRIKCLLLCNETIYCSLDRDNAVAIWDVESATQTKQVSVSLSPKSSPTKVASGAQPNAATGSQANATTSKQSSNASSSAGGASNKVTSWPATVTDLVVDHKNKCMVTATDFMDITYWNLGDERKSASVSKAPPNNHNQFIESTGKKVHIQPNDFWAHRDTITCLASSVASEVLLSADRSGVVKIWR